MYQWQLDDLYPAFDSSEFKEDWRQLQEFQSQFDQLTYQDQIEDIKQAVKVLENYTLLARRLGAFISLQLAVNTLDKEANNSRTQYSSLTSKYTKSLVSLRRFLSEIETDISSDDYLKEYQFFFNELKEQSQYLLAEEVEEVISRLNISGGQAWSNLQTYLTSITDQEFRGESLTLSELRNLAYSADADVRKEAYHRELALYDKIKEPIAFAINNIKKQVLATSDLRGYKSPLQATLIQSRMSQETLNSLMSSIKEYLPEFRRYLKLKAEYLGHENGLPFYDLFAPMGKTSQQFSVEAAGEYLIENFRPFSSDLANLVQESIDNKYIDFLPRKGKSGGAFCSNLPFIKQSRIMLNFDGSLSSVVTMAHELGHAYHGKIIQDHQPLNWSYSMPVAETASTFNETIIMNNLLKNSRDKEEKIALIESLLQDTTQIIVDIYSRFYFEDKLFEYSQDQFLFSSQLEELMLEAQDQAYGEGLDPNYKHPFMWINKSHYYSTGLSYYNFPYAFGGLFARGLYSIYEDNPEGFLDKYNDLLYTTTIGSVEEVGQKMGIDLSQEDFWHQSLNSFVQYIDQLEALLEEGQ